MSIADDDEGSGAALSSLQNSLEEEEERINTHRECVCVCVYVQCIGACTRWHFRGRKRVIECYAAHMASARAVYDFRALGVLALLRIFRIFSRVRRDIVIVSWA